MTKRAVPLRTVAVLAIGFAALGAILYYASTVDARGPTVLGISLTQHLTGDAEQALTTTSIEVAFSEPVEHPQAEAAFAISPSVQGAFSWSATSLTFTPAQRLPLRTDFEVTIGPGVHDDAGNAMTGAPRRFSFTTVGNPTVVSSDPADADLGVALDAPILLDFSTLMDTASVEAAIELEPASSVSFRWSRERLTVTPSSPWQPNHHYSLTIGVGARDQTGTPLAHTFSLSFRTVTSGLTVETMVPADGVAGVAVTTPIALVFDQVLDPQSVQDSLLTVSPEVAGSLSLVVPPGAAGLSDGGLRILRFQPSGPLDPNTTYQVTLGPGLRGAGGAGMPAGMSWSFTTGSPTATLSNQVVFLSDRAGVPNLWAMNPDGSNQRQLSVELSPVTSYSIAPDGRSFITGDGAGITWQRADGGARSLLTDRGVVEYDAAYSPDGSVMTFGR
ncbi:MAG: Ig-like domain-containing protein, partial [Candidatus Limnocylindria bacterium]